MPLLTPAARVESIDSGIRFLLAHLRAGFILATKESRPVIRSQSHPAFRTKHKQAHSQAVFAVGVPVAHLDLYPGLVAVFERGKLRGRRLLIRVVNIHG